MRLARVFETPKNSADGFMEAIAEACEGYSAEVYERAFVKLRDGRRYRTLPMPAEAKAICDDQRDFLEAVSKRTAAGSQTTTNGDWSPEYAFNFIRGTPIAREAARDGWIGPLVGHVRQVGRAPAWTEVAGLKKIQREFEDALMVAPGNLRTLGEAMAGRQQAWAAAVLAQPNGATA